jgi:NADPH:quinone reductase-like Zn-dependent oxidoreductase
MRVYEIRDSFGLDHLTPAVRSDDDLDRGPGPGELLLAMRAASLNYRDLLMVEGHYNPRQPLPLVPCSDGVGEVLAVGDGVSRFAVGDRVCPIFARRWISGPATHERLRSTLGGPYDGTLAERMTVPEQSAVAAPDHLDDAEAACLPCAAVTAWSALALPGADGAGTLPGDTVLTLGTGGVSIFALQLAVLAGARVVVTSSSDEKLERARALGAWETLNYREVPDWGRPVRRLTGGAGVDRVIEVGGAGTLEQSLQAVRIGGTVAMIGVLAGHRSPLAVTPILMKQLRVQGVLVGPRDAFEAMNRALTDHRLRPVVDRVFGFDEVPEAFEHLASGRHFGKVAVRIAE